MPKCKNDSSVSYTGIEPSPLGMGYCASGVNENTIMVGRNGKKWIAKETGNSTKWEKYVKTEQYDSDEMIDYRTRSSHHTNNEKKYKRQDNLSSSDSASSVNSDNSNNSYDSIDDETNQGIIKFINLETSIADYYVNKIHKERINKEHLDSSILKKFNSKNTMKSLYKHAMYKYLTNSDNRSDLNMINETGMWKNHNKDYVVDDIYYSVLEHVTATTKFKKMDEFCKK